MFFDHILIHFSHFNKYKLHFLLLNLKVDNQYNIHSFFHKMHIMKDEHNLFLNIYFFQFPFYFSHKDYMSMIKIAQEKAIEFFSKESYVNNVHNFYNYLLK